MMCRSLPPPAVGGRYERTPRLRICHCRGGRPRAWSTGQTEGRETLAERADNSTAPADVLPRHLLEGSFNHTPAGPEQNCREDDVPAAAAPLAPGHWVMAALVLLLCSLATSLLILTLKSHALDELQQQRAQGQLQRWQAAGGRFAPPPPGAAARLQVRGGLLLLGGHLVAMLLRTDRSRLTEPAGLAGEAAVPLVLGLLLVALPSLLPRAFERHHTLLVGTARVAVFTASDVHNPRGLLFVFQAGLVWGCWVVAAFVGLPASSGDRLA